MSAKVRAAGRAWRAPSLLVFAAAGAVASLADRSASAEELLITNPPMMEISAVTVDPEPEPAAAPLASASIPAEDAEALVAQEPPVPKVVARVDLSDQTMTVYVEEKLSYVFKVSTGRRGYGTPTGRWNAEWLSPRHRSKKYNYAPMPWSVFFHGGYAVHGTSDVRRLGRPASHGCVRLLPANAKTFYKLVQENGKDNTRSASCARGPLRLRS